MKLTITFNVDDPKYNELDLVLEFIKKTFKVKGKIRTLLTSLK